MGVATDVVVSGKVCCTIVSCNPHWLHLILSKCAYTHTDIPAVNKTPLTNMG